MQKELYRKISPPPSEAKHKQEPFSRVAPILKTALLMGACSGFLLATVLTVTRAASVPLGAWWEAVAQAHGHIQLYGWAGLFVLGVALHFLPRLGGTPLVGARLVPWLLGAMIVSLILRAVSQPLLVMNLGSMWRVGLISSGILEVGAIVMVLSSLTLSALLGPRATIRPAYGGVFPFIAGAFCSLALASIINILNVIQAGLGSGLVLDAGDTLNVTLGLLGFLVPMALAMSARSLPMYAGLDSFPRRVLWSLACVYFAGLILLCVGVDRGPVPSPWVGIIEGLGMALLGWVVLIFVGIFLSLIGRRGQLPGRVAKLAPSPETMAHTYQQHMKKEQTNYGPFVRLVASAYLWAMFGALLLLINGVSALTTGNGLVALDAIRHSFALGFIALLICGIASRMLPSFSGGKLVSPKLVSATFWLGNVAALLRVSSILFAPLLTSTQGIAVNAFLFGLSGPCGLALAICLAINLWPTLEFSPKDVV